MIGNYVLFDTWICRVDQINPPYINISHEGHERCVHIDKLEPLPIQKKLLIKNGFVEDIDDGDCYFDKIVDGYRISFLWDIANPADICFYIFGKDDNRLYGCLTYAKYIHQVQNLMNILGVKLEFEIWK